MVVVLCVEGKREKRGTTRCVLCGTALIHMMWYSPSSSPPTPIGTWAPGRISYWKLLPTEDNATEDNAEDNAEDTSIH